MDIMDLFRDKLENPAILGKLAQTVGASPDQVRKVTEIGVPALLGGMTDNSQSPEGAEALANALDQHQDDPVDDVDGYLDHVDRNDGNKILGHLLGGERPHVENSLARQTGLDSGQVGGLLAQLAPLLMGMLGRQKRASGVDAGGLPGLLSNLGGLFGGEGGGCGLSGLLSKLDANQDGNFMDDVNTMFNKFRNR